MWSKALPRPTASSKVKRVPSTEASSDGLDELLAAAAAERSSGSAAAPRPAPEPVARARRPVEDEGVDLTPAAVAAHDAIVALRLQLADATVTERVNAALAERPAEAFFEYYDANESLAAYTLERELKRNAFVVRIEGGREISGEAAAAVLKAEGGYLLRIANQSVFGDCVAALAEALRSSDAMASVSNPADAETRYEVDLTAGALRASCAVAVVVPTSDTPDGKLPLATVRCAVDVALAPTRTATRRVTRATLVNVFDAATRRAAVEIANCQAADAFDAAPPPPAASADATMIGPSRVLEAAKRASRSATTKLKQRLERSNEPDFASLLREAADRDAAPPPPDAEPDFASLLREAADREVAPPPPPPQASDGDLGAMLASRLAF